SPGEPFHSHRSCSPAPRAPGTPFLEEEGSLPSHVPYPRPQTLLIDTLFMAPSMVPIVSAAFSKLPWSFEPPRSARCALLTTRPRKPISPSVYSTEALRLKPRLKAQSSLLKSSVTLKLPQSSSQHRPLINTPL